MFNTPALRPAVAIALGAVVGAVSRYYVEMGVNHLLGSVTPVGTLVVNVTGCGAMGFAATVCFAPQVQVHPELRLFVLTGFMGSYTTFSSYELDSVHLWTEQRWGLGFLYWAGSGILGWLCLELGSGLAGRLIRNTINRQP
ncbi:crcB protein [Gloeomargarita lithophora Alchichica-D10]|uniref:Fluoride-specific ion channel FluC n=1 Tax=Gloeomargarita lithophora Alchichica-D10 TaxID=1188229 RepID=A0A1J0AEV0_9CYAN|nr:fluoride efflux transporter CrcB [Gloeomargarita lithophora]APB34460.1 crcB protein [Gloeomargarita lithophora Alchichica-D10]